MFTCPAYAVVVDSGSGMSAPVSKSEGGTIFLFICYFTICIFILFIG